jgi:chromosome segregation ATPase
MKNDEFTSIQRDIEKLNTLLEDFDENEEDLDKMGKTINDYNQKYNILEEKLSDIKDIIDDESKNKKPLLNKYDLLKKDIELIKKKIEEKDYIYQKSRRQSMYFNNELEGADKSLAEREILLDNQKETDNQGIMIDEIQDNVKTTQNNLKNMNTELKSSSERIDNIHEKVGNTDKDLKITGKIFTRMERRNTCMKVCSTIMVIILGILDIAWIGYLLLRKYYL